MNESLKQTIEIGSNGELIVKANQINIINKNENEISGDFIISARDVLKLISLLDEKKIGIFTTYNMVGSSSIVYNESNETIEKIKNLIDEHEDERNKKVEKDISNKDKLLAKKDDEINTYKQRSIELYDECVSFENQLNALSDFKKKLIDADKIITVAKKASNNNFF